MAATMRLPWRRERAEPEPNVAFPPSPEVLRAILRLDLHTRRFVESLFTGEYSSVFHGRGFEFSHVRAYQPGDDVRSIDWRVTARRGIPYVRQFVEERDLFVVLLVDISASGRLGPGKKSAADIATEIAAALAFAAVRRNDRVAMLLVTDRVEQTVRAGSGQRHVVRMLSTLLSFRPRGRGTNLAVGLEAIGRSFSGRSAVFVLSDFIDVGPEASFRQVMGRVARRHDVIAVRLLGRSTDELPDAGWVEMTDPETGRRIVLNTGNRRVRERYRRGVQRAHAAMASLLTEAGAELLDIDTATDPLLALTDFFRRRQRAPR